MHHIETTGPPIQSKPRSLNPKLFDAVRKKKEFQFMMDQGISRLSKFPWSSLLHVRSKSSDRIHTLEDYRRLNSRTVPNRYSIPLIQDFSNCMEKRFSQNWMQHVQNTAVCTPFGLSEFLYLNFMLCRAAQTFQRFIYEILGDLPFCNIYLDNILICSANEEKHKAHLWAILERLNSYGLTINVSKCIFGASEVSLLLGHLITSNGTKPLLDKVESILNYS